VGRQSLTPANDVCGLSPEAQAVSYVPGYLPGEKPKNEAGQMMLAAARIKAEATAQHYPSDGKLQGEAMKPAIGYIRVSTARQGRTAQMEINVCSDMAQTCWVAIPRLYSNGHRRERATTY
jgi:hypothetical protein